MSTSTTGHTAHSERPERSRNAKAQARHRAKRKAYIDQLEQTVTKLQTALGFSPEEVSALPPPLIKIRELEQEVARLQKENEDYRRMLQDSGGRSFPVEISSRNTLSSFMDSRPDCDRDSFKRRKMAGDIYMSPDTPSHATELLSRPGPPPLTIPQPMSHHYSNVSHQSSSGHSNGGSSQYNLSAASYGIQAADTPVSESSGTGTSSPPFSPTASMQPSNSPINHRPPSLSSHPSHQSLSNYALGGSNYGPVKVEDEHHYSSNHHGNHSSHYSLPPFQHPASSDHMDSWHSYSSERAPIHR